MTGVPPTLIRASGWNAPLAPAGEAVPHQANTVSGARARWRDPAAGCTERRIKLEESRLCSAKPPNQILKTAITVRPKPPIYIYKEVPLIQYNNHRC